MQKLLLSLLLSLVVGQVISQNTVGLLSYDPEQTSEGYNLVFPHNQPDVFLLDNCGEIVHRWPGVSGEKPGNGVYLQDNGWLYVCYRDDNNPNGYIGAGGQGDKVEIKDWDNNILWSFVWSDSLKRLHHDISILPNGNILMISWERITDEVAIQAGRNPALLPDGELWPDYILEVQPDMMNDTFDIVWEWHAMDHIIQDFDPTKDNFGVVADNPHLININYVNGTGIADWHHANAIDYNVELDQIMLSVPTFSEFWIIDHSTTTEEAATGTGGMSGRGGDLMYRWGNPEAYGQGTPTDRKSFYQHDTHWLDQSLDASHPDYDKIGFYSNREPGDISSIYIIDNVFDETTWSYPMMDGKFLPEDYSWSYNTPDPTDMYSNILSGMQRLPNGNTLIDVGRPGYYFEINPIGEVVWEYQMPLNAGMPVTQGTPASTFSALTFNITRYPLDYPAFVGRDLTSLGWIELNPNEDFCNQILPVEEIKKGDISIFPNPVSDELIIQNNTGDIILGDLRVTDVLGREILQIQIESTTSIQVSDWAHGIYFISHESGWVEKIIVE